MVRLGLRILAELTPNSTCGACVEKLVEVFVTPLFEGYLGEIFDVVWSRHSFTELRRNGSLCSSDKSVASSAEGSGNLLTEASNGTPRIRAELT